ncbi:MAG: DNA-processing protein DprA [Lachnospiraceae bacterium]|nr:DNA-processing protein DprA [Lachnospiraceae bacterium]
MEYNMEQQLKRLFAAQLAEVMPAALRQLLAVFGDSERLWDGIPERTDVLDCLTEEQKNELCLARKRGLPLSLGEQIEKGRIRTVCIEEEAYPQRLRMIRDAPFMLFYKGELPEEDRPVVAVVGARHCSDYGRRAAEFFGRELASVGVPVVSGMAMGIDGLAQAACLQAGEKSYGVLGCGVDVVYPPSNRQLYRELTEHGCVISEFLPGSGALPFRFPLRNRLISALSDLLLVVEAREKSGTFITVDYALEQGREVYAVPGRVEDKLSFGCNRLIAQGAGAAYCVEEILLALKGESSRGSLRPATGEEEEDGQPPEAAAKVLPRKVSCPAGAAEDACWQGELRHAIRKLLLDAPGTAQEIYARLGKPKLAIQELLSELMQLQIEGLLLCRGGRYELQ